MDEPTAACDAASAASVEAALSCCGAAVVWVTHDPTQARRVGGRVLTLHAPTDGDAAAVVVETPEHP